jgi:hypothetical protein
LCHCDSLYAYGVLCYDLYTVAGDLARLVIEQALRERFLPFYNRTVTFVHDRDGSERVISAGNWDEFRAALPPSRQWRLRLRSGREDVRFNRMPTSLLRWARAEGLHEDRMLYLPRSAATAAALGSGEWEGTWYLIRADHPFAAFSHQRQVLAEVPGHAAAGDCKACPVQTIAAGDIDAVLGKCEEPVSANASGQHRPGNPFR